MVERLKQLDRQTIILLVLAGLVGLLLFSAIAGGIWQAGWNEGFMVGLFAGGGENAKAVTPYLGYHAGYRGYGVHGWGWRPFGFIGGFFRFLFFGFLFLMFVRFLGFWRWRMHRGHPWHHHHHGPWARHGWDEQGQPYGEQPNQPQTQQGNPPPPPVQPDANTPQPTSWVKV